MKGLSGWAALLLAGCATFTPQTHEPAAPPPSSRSVDGLAGAIKAAAKQDDQVSDPKIRDKLAKQARADADACLKLNAHAAACLYGQAIAIGLEARAHPTKATQLLTDILASLRSAEVADPNYDHAGPARVQASVLLRAPVWPLGPGDVDAGLADARRAVRLAPEYPPNLLALAEGFSKTGDAAGARDSYVRARDAAQALPVTPDRDDWLRQANEALQGR